LVSNHIDLRATPQRVKGNIGNTGSVNSTADCFKLLLERAPK